MIRFKNLFLIPLMAVSLVVVTGCAPPSTAEQANDKKANDKPADDGTGIFNKMTQDVVEYDPAIHKEMVNDKDDINLVTGALGAYGPVTEKLAGQQLTRSLEMFRATNGRYPKDHKEFMRKVIKEGGLKFPMLRTNRQYAYDVDNHSLIIVEKEKE